MDKENQGNKEKEADVPGILLEGYEHGDTQGFTTTTTENDPARVLQLSESFFVADTLEDDESIIPPTQELLIPSTPPLQVQSSSNEDTSKGNDTTLSNLDETHMEDLKEDAKSDEIQVLEREDEVIDISSQNDLTQDLPELDATQQILVERPNPMQYSLKEGHDDGSKEDGDDDWNLRFTDTQETQELLSSVKLKAKESKQLSEVLEEDDISTTKKTDSPKLESKDAKIAPATLEDACEKENESEDEVEPSQSCLIDYQADTHLTYLDRVSQSSPLEHPTHHSTPEINLNGKAAKACSSSDVLLIPSPIPTKPEASGDNPPSNVLTPEPKLTIESLTSEYEKSTEIISFENKKEDIPSLTVDSHSVQQAPTKTIDNADVSEGEKEREQKSKTQCETIELLSSADDTMLEDVEAQAIPEPESQNLKKGAKPVEAEPVKTSEEKVEEKISIPNVSSFEVEVEASEVLSVENSGDIKNDLPETVPTLMLPPLPPRGRLSRKPRMERYRKRDQVSSMQEKSEKSFIGTFKDVSSLERIFNSFGIFLEPKHSEGILSLKPSEEVQVVKTLNFFVKDNNVYLGQFIKFGAPNDPKLSEVAVSPHSGSSSSTITSNSTVSTITSLHSGEMGDISSSSSVKSANSFGMQLDTTVHSSSLSSQENAQKTSTQNSEHPNSFTDIFNSKKGTGSFEIGKSEEPEVKKELSPIKYSKAAQMSEVAGPSGRRKGGRKVAPLKTQLPPPPMKRKRGRAPKNKKDEPGEQTTENDAESDEKAKKRKITRRKKNDVEEVPVISAPISISRSDVQEMVAAESSGDAYSDSPYGSIIPGVRVMARWKDGYYYPGVVSSQNSEARWLVRFEDNDIRNIPQENLIKLAILEKGTSILVQSADGYYDPGIICGYFREGDKVGYDVELDTGVTKRFARTSVILSTDQAKLLTSCRPPTTPATMTINLDNIIDGKRKRKSIQSLDPAQTVKKSPRISKRIAKIDPNLDNTDVSDKDATKQSNVTTTTEAEEETVRQRGAVKKRETVRQRETSKRKAAAKGAAKITKVYDQGPRDPKLFKDYAFILTNADKKAAPKSGTDSEPCTDDEEIIPFDKHDLVSFIGSRGGIILDRFDDVQKCKRRFIYLLANTFLRTMKYIQCLASGISCIKHHWVQNCCFKRQILNLSSYILPAGKSIITTQIVEWHGKNDVLKGMKISLVSAPEDPFVYTWAPVLLAAKADFVQKFSLPSSKSGVHRVDVLVTNPLCPEDILRSARLKKIPIVSTEWVIQSLIAGNVLPFDAHPKFSYDFSE